MDPLCCTLHELYTHELYVHESYHELDDSEATQKLFDLGKTHSLALVFVAIVGIIEIG